MDTGQEVVIVIVYLSLRRLNQSIVNQRGERQEKGEERRDAGTTAKIHYAYPHALAHIAQAQVISVCA